MILLNLIEICSRKPAIYLPIFLFKLRLYGRILLELCSGKSRATQTSTQSGRSSVQVRDRLDSHPMPNLSSSCADKLLRGHEQYLDKQSAHAGARMSLKRLPQALRSLELDSVSHSWLDSPTQSVLECAKCHIVHLL
jgi:hypothetical protein